MLRVTLIIILIILNLIDHSLNKEFKKPIKQCGNPGNSMVAMPKDIEGTSFPVGTKVEYQCDTFLFGPDGDRTCKSNGPQCQPVQTKTG